MMPIISTGTIQKEILEQQNIRDAAEHLSQMLPDWQEAD